MQRRHLLNTLDAAFPLPFLLDFLSLLSLPLEVGPTAGIIDVYWTVVMHYNSSVAEHWTIFAYALYVVCMYFVSLIQLLLPNQINQIGVRGSGVI